MVEKDTQTGTHLGPVKWKRRSSLRVRKWTKRSVSTHAKATRIHVAWLLWCVNEGYVLAEDRAVIAGPDTFEANMQSHPSGLAELSGWLDMADSVLFAIDNETGDMEISLCKCGVDLDEHDDIDDHEFDAAGTRHRCGASIQSFLCPRPAYHDEENVPCGPLTGKKLW